MDGNADGVFLIAHGSNAKRKQTELIVDCYNSLRNTAWGKDAFVGVNLLFQRRPLDVFPFMVEHMPTADAVWVDDCLAWNPRLIEDVAQKRKCFQGLYIGGVAFKHAELVHQDQEREFDMDSACAKALKRVCQLAMQHCDLVATSGAKTGEKPNLHKVQCLRSVCKPLAVSGFGLDADHGCCDVFFCATAISRKCPHHGVQDGCAESFCYFDPDLLRVWVKNVHSALH